VSSRKTAQPHRTFFGQVCHIFSFGDRQGLRSLSKFDPRYRGRYEGGVRERDTGYHQGTVWPWLMGGFITAYVKVNKGSAEARNQAHAWLEGFHDHLATGGLGHVSEITDAEAPHEARGCIAQAWSVAELLRAAVEDVYQMRSQAKSVAASQGDGVLNGVLAPR